MFHKRKYNICYETIVVSPHGIKRYYGKHSTDNLNDGYVGSGVYITRAKKLSYQMFVNRVVTFDCEDDAYEFEELLVNEAKEKYGKNCLNMKPGGRGGFCLKQSPETIEKRVSKFRGIKRPKYIGEKVRKTKLLNPYTHTDDIKKTISNMKNGIKIDKIFNEARSARMKGRAQPWARSELWNYEDELYQLWLIDKFGKKRFRKLVASKGYPDLDCGHMVKLFQKRV